MEWYYTKDKMQVGPISQEELIRKISAGEVSSNEYAWNEGVTDWKPISSFPELQITANPAGATPPPVGSAAPSPTGSTAPTPVGSTVPTPQAGVPAAPKTSGLAIASLCLGIGSIVLCGVFMGIPAVICGHLALGQIKRSQENLQGKAMAIIGLIIGYFSIVATVVMILFFALMSGNAMSSGDYYTDEFMWDESYPEPLIELETESDSSFESREPELVPDSSQ